MWNQKLADGPPLYTHKALNKNLNLTKFRNALHFGLEHFNNDNFWDTEIALLRRIIYRMKMKFRSSKDFKLLEKLRRQIEKCYEIDAAKHLKSILSMVPQKYGSSNTYIPSKNMLDFLLVKLQGLAKVLVKSFETCLQACAEINQRLYIGHFWMQFFILFALVSRLSALIKFKTKFVCDLYGKLLRYSQHLRNDGFNWLPKDCTLPKDLKVWLEVLWVYDDEFVDLTFEPTTVDFMNLIEDDDEDVMFCEEYILLDEEDKRIARDFSQLAPIKDVFKKNRMRGFSIGEDDIGEEIMEIIELNNTNAKENMKPEEELLLSSGEEEENPENMQDSVIFIEETSAKNVKNRKRKSIKVPTEPVIIEEEDEEQHENIEAIIDVGEELEPAPKKKKKNKKKKLKQLRQLEQEPGSSRWFFKAQNNIQNEVPEIVTPTNEEITRVINPAILGVVTQANERLEKLPARSSKRKRGESDEKETIQAMDDLGHLLEEMENYVEKVAREKARKKPKSVEEESPKNSPEKSPKKGLKNSPKNSPKKAGKSPGGKIKARLSGNKTVKKKKVNQN